MKTKSLSKSFLPLVISSAVAGIISSIASPAQAIVQTWKWNSNTTDHEGPNFIAQGELDVNVENNLIVGFRGTRRGGPRTNLTSKITDFEPYVRWLGPDNGWFDKFTYYTDETVTLAGGKESVTVFRGGYIDKNTMSIKENDQLYNHLYKATEPGFFQANLVPPVPVPFETSPYSVLVSSLALGAMVAAKKAKQNIALKTRVANPVETIS
jgi:hypothetical protein